MNRAKPARILALAAAFAALGFALPLMAQFAGGVVGGAPATKPATRPGMAGGVVGGTPTAPAPVNPNAPPAAWVPAKKTFPAVPPDPIERPEFRNKAVPIKKSVTSATAMMVVHAGGSEVGLTSDVIANLVGENTSTVPTFVLKQGKIGPEMQTSFDEAIRAVKVRYPKWEPGHIEFSFGEKYTPHDGGSAGTCFAVMLLSEIEGFDIDKKCAVTGDITVDWKVRRIGGVSAKLRGATADKCLYAGVPLDNANDVADMYLLYGFETIRDIQIFSIDSLQEATALLRKDRTPQMTEAMKEFTDLKAHMQVKDALASRDVQRTLEQILTLAPNHYSAQALLDLGKGNAPKQVSATAALEVIDSTVMPYFAILQTADGISRQTIPTTLTNSSRKQLNALRPYVPKELNKLLVDTTAIVETTETFAAAKQQPNLTVLKTRWEAFITDYDALGMDKSFREKLMRE